MEIRRYALAEHGQVRVAIRAIVQIAQDLVESAVFLNDVDHVRDVLVQGGHRGGGNLALRRAVGVVGGHLVGQSTESVGGGNRGRQKAGFFDLEIILVAGIGLVLSLAVAFRVFRALQRVGGCAGIVRVWARIALAVHHIKRAAVLADGNGLRIPAGGDQPRGAVRRSTREGYDGNRVLATVRDVKRITMKRQVIGGGAGIAFGAGRYARRPDRVDLFDNVVIGEIDHRHVVGIIL